MNNLIALTSRELKAFWFSPIAYVVGALFLVLQGVVFWLLVSVLNDPASQASFSIGEAFFGPNFFYLTSVLITIPFLTMRTFSEEKRTGSIELLLTAPVTDMQVVLAKFLGAWFAYILLWLMTLGFFLYLRTMVAFDWAPVWTGFLGTWLLGGVMASVGILTSSLTRNQVIAAAFCFVILLLLCMVGMLEFFFRDPETTRLIRYVSLLNHLEDFSRGVVDTRPVVYYLSLTSIMLFFTGRVLNSPRWRA